MESEIIEPPIIDPELRSYETFFDYDWAKDIISKVTKSLLEDAMGKLMVAWRSINGAHLLPWLMVESLRKFADGEHEGRLRYRATYLENVIAGLVEKLET